MTVERDEPSVEDPTDTLPSPDDVAASASARPESEQAPETGRYAVGDVVAERYEVLSLLGSGVSGTVYKARDLYVDSGHEIVALKAIHEKLHSDRQIKGRFKREAAILRKLEGRHLCRMLECIEEDDLLLIALEYVDGPSLDDYAKSHGPLPIEEIIAILTQICAGLTSAHDGGVIHRDLKPSNVLIEGMTKELEEGEPPPSFLGELRVRLVDFGLAKMVAPDSAGTVLTEQDMVFGTPDYMAPEQVSGDDLDTRCDVYAAGVILFELLAGRVPYDTPSPLATMTAHLNEPIPSVREQAASRRLSRAFDSLVTKVLAKKPDERFGTADELAEALAALELEEDGPDTLDDELDVGDTQLDQESLDSEDDDTPSDSEKRHIGTTLRSEKVAEDAPTGRGAKVRVVVRDADPIDSGSHAPSSRITADDGENRFWVIAAVIAGLIAIAAGLWMGGR